MECFLRLWDCFHSNRLDVGSCVTDECETHASLRARVRSQPPSRKQCGAWPCLGSLTVPRLSPQVLSRMHTSSSLSVAMESTSSGNSANTSTKSLRCHILTHRAQRVQCPPSALCVMKNATFRPTECHLACLSAHALFWHDAFSSGRWETRNTSTSLCQTPPPPLHLPIPPRRAKLPGGPADSDKLTMAECSTSLLSNLLHKNAHAPSRHHSSTGWGGEERLSGQNNFQPSKDFFHEDTWANMTDMTQACTALLRDTWLTTWRLQASLVSPAIYQKKNKNWSWIVTLVQEDKFQPAEDSWPPLTYLQSGWKLELMDPTFLFSIMIIPKEASKYNNAIT